MSLRDPAEDLERGLGLLQVLEHLAADHELGTVVLAQRIDVALRDLDVEVRAVLARRGHDLVREVRSAQAFGSRGREHACEVTFAAADLVYVGRGRLAHQFEDVAFEAAHQGACDGIGGRVLVVMVADRHTVFRADAFGHQSSPPVAVACAPRPNS